MTNLIVRHVKNQDSLQVRPFVSVSPVVTAKESVLKKLEVLLQGTHEC